MTAQPQLISIIITAAVVMAIMLFRNNRPRRLRVEVLWLRSAIYLALIGATFLALPVSYDPSSLAIMAAGLVIGVGAGWMRGRLVRIEVHPQTHDISAQASPAAMVFILALMVLRTSLRGLAASSPAPGLSASALTDGLILLAGGLMIARNLEMGLRATRLLRDARAASAGSQGGGTPIVR
ncbi:MAG TPA: hypothetical protein VIC25_11225 [Caulobacteraceae bacterium]